MKKAFPLIFMIAAMCIVPFGFITLPTTLSISALSMYVSALFGYIGTMMLLWMFILGARRISRYFIRDYSVAMKIHNFLGKYGLMLILAHPILVALGYGASILYAFVPNISSDFEIYVSLGKIALFILILIWISSIKLRSKLRYKPWKYLHFLSYFIIPLVLIHIPFTGSNFAISLPAQIYFWLLFSGYLLFVIYRAYSWFGFDKCKYEIITNEKILDRVYEIKLRPLSNRTAIDIESGQYIYISKLKVTESHPFSVASINNDRTISIIYKTYGNFTKKLTNQISGQKIYVSGPYGDFLGEINDSEQNVFIAGGIGITPFIGSILKNPKNKYLIYANHDIGSAVYHDQLSSALGDKLFDLISVDEQGRRLLGRSEQSEKLKQIVRDNFNPSDKKINYYLCGPKPQVKSFITTLKNAGVISGRIHSETFDF